MHFNNANRIMQNEIDTKMCFYILSGKKRRKICSLETTQGWKELTRVNVLYELRTKIHSGTSLIT